MEKIGIQKVLDEIRNNDRKQPFVLQFVRATGKKKGSIKTVRAVYGASDHVSKKTTTAPSSGALHIDKGTLPITNVDTGEYETPLIATFIKFNGKTISH
jgi:hypothetical protein